jgi:hypothetical protein
LFLDYALPRGSNLLPLDISLAALPTAGNPLGVKGAALAGCMAGPQTIIHAILERLAPLDMPSTAARVLARDPPRAVTRGGPPERRLASVNVRPPFAC